jgi:exodeoxyribonuclease VII small subunit
MTKAPSFEDRFINLQAIVERFERGDVPLAESLTLFKEGMGLVKALEEELKQTEQTLEEIERDFTQSESLPPALATDETA